MGMKTSSEDRVIREMFRECFGERYDVEGLCVMGYFRRVKEAIEGMESVLVPELGMFTPRYILSWRRYIDGELGIRDVEGVARGALRELDEVGYDDDYRVWFIERYNLKQYIDEDK